LPLLTGNYALGLGILLLYVIITVVRNVLEPRIVGKRIGLHPLVTLILMYHRTAFVRDTRNVFCCPFPLSF
jgi:predicted PurR-regulated permease PerM